MSGATYVWLDMETTGLDLAEDNLLELSAILTDDTFTIPDDGPIQFHVVCRLPDAWDRSTPESWPIDPPVRAMHAQNGLLPLVMDLVDAPDEQDTIGLFADWLPPGPLIAAGSGILGFDLPWLRHYWPPEKPWPFHYRALDLSPVRSMLQLAGLDTHLDASSGTTKRHRALDDAQAHLAEARLIRDTLTRMHRADTAMGHMIDLQDGPDANPPGGEL